MNVLILTALFKYSIYLLCLMFIYELYFPFFCLHFYKVINVDRLELLYECNITEFVLTTENKA